MFVHIYYGLILISLGVWAQIDCFKHVNKHTHILQLNFYFSKTGVKRSQASALVVLNAQTKTFGNTPVSYYVYCAVNVLSIEIGYYRTYISGIDQALLFHLILTSLSFALISFMPNMFIWLVSVYDELVVNLFNFFRHFKSPLFHTVIRVHLISLWCACMFFFCLLNIIKPTWCT